MRCFEQRQHKMAFHRGDRPSETRSGKQKNSCNRNCNERYQHIRNRASRRRCLHRRQRESRNSRGNTATMRHDGLYPHSRPHQIAQRFPRRLRCPIRMVSATNNKKIRDATRLLFFICSFVNSLTSQQRAVLLCC